MESLTGQIFSWFFADTSEVMRRLNNLCRRRDRRGRAGKSVAFSIRKGSSGREGEIFGVRKGRRSF